MGNKKDAIDLSFYAVALLALAFVPLAWLCRCLDKMGTETDVAWTQAFGRLVGGDKQMAQTRVEPTITLTEQLQEEKQRCVMQAPFPRTF